MIDNKIVFCFICVRICYYGLIRANKGMITNIKYAKVGKNFKSAG